MPEQPDRPEWFVNWVTDYATSFGVGEELTGVMLRKWWPAYLAAGYEAEDFALAAEALVTSPTPPNYPREHIGAINRALVAAREKRAARRGREANTQAGRPEGAECQFCECIGFVSVPLIDDLDAETGEWLAPYRTMAVACTRCGPGMWQFNKSGGAGATLDGYQKRVNPQWWHQMRQREEASRAHVAALNATDGLPPLAEIVKGRLENLLKLLSGQMTPPRDRRRRQENRTDAA